jgi:CubicO group peptidase (beta-lactamase class C family)
MSRLIVALANLLVALVALPGCAQSAEQTLPEQIDAVFREAHADGEFNGNVLVTRGEAIVYQGSFGLADHARTIANGADTKFLAFSVNKPLTAILVFQLIESGKLRLDDRLEQFFPNLARRAAGGISLRQLLTHTSGIEEVISRHRDRRITGGDLEAAVVKGAGSEEYSSSGFVILALVLEAVTARTYAELLEENILRPAGMADSGLLRSGVPVTGLAMGYRIVDGKHEAAPLGIAPEVMEGAGRLYTTIGDLRRLDQALNAGGILSRRSQELMATPQIGDRGFGWSLGEQGGKYFPWHMGSYRGFTAVFVRQVHRHEMIAILSNDQDTNILGLRTKVLRLLKRHAQGS